MAENCRRLLEALEDGKLRAVALAKMEGCTGEEIAKRLKCSVPTVERKLNRIRKIWEKEAKR
jgi:DNA-directed RNA polymerase specialized sigma24 family protein